MSQPKMASEEPAIGGTGGWRSMSTRRGASLLPLNHDSRDPDVIALCEQRVNGREHEVHLQSRVHHEYSASPAGGLHSPLDGSLGYGKNTQRKQH